MGAINAKLRWDIGAHAYCATHHGDIEAFDIEWRKQEFRAHIAVVEIGCVFPPHTKHALCVVVSLMVPVGRVAINRIGSKRPPKGGMPIGRGVSRIDGAVGVYGYCGNTDPTKSGFGVYAQADRAFPYNYAGFFLGSVVITGDLTLQDATVAAKIKNAIVPFPDGTKRVLHCMESPEHWFEDFGTATQARPCRR